jgi:DNA-binding XRE family transcriptional regulator
VTLRDGGEIFTDGDAQQPIPAPPRGEEPTRNERPTSRVGPEHTVVQPMAIGTQLRIWRENNGYTQQHIASHLGVSQPYISQIEKGTIAPSATVKHKLNFLLGNINRL